MTNVSFRAEEVLAELRPRVMTWAEDQPDLLAVVLVGSYARGEARPDSDVDLVLLFEEAAARLVDTSWIEDFGEVQSTDRHSYGAVESLFVRYREGPEVEFAVTGAVWAELCSTDPATRGVITRGMVVWHDPGRVMEGVAG